MQTKSDDSDRRTYWAQQMELGYEMVQQLIAFPVAECGEAFASLPDAAAAANVEMLFSTSKIAGELERVFFLRDSLARDLVGIGKEMNARGWILKIEDGFRSLEMQGHLVRKQVLFDAILKKCIWENSGRIPSIEMIFRRAIVLIANIPKIGTHMSGSAVDISVFNRNDGSEVWRGHPYLEMSECTPMRSPFIDAKSLENRLEITSLMESHGFMHFPFEFWHFNKNDAGGHILTSNPAPARYGAVNWNPLSNVVTPVENPLTPLNPLPAFEKEVAAAMKRAEETPS